MKCAICGKEFHGFYHSCVGALDENLKPMNFNHTDKCCDDCYKKRVLPNTKKNTDNK